MKSYYHSWWTSATMVEPLLKEKEEIVTSPVAIFNFGVEHGAMQLNMQTTPREGHII